ncbi:trans-sialidase [Trypanosoma cruzi]|nr:trans-sialidase [Trypanosoma cruzi]
MSRRVFTSAVLLLVVVMMCCGTGRAAQAEVEPSSDPKFQWKDIKSEGEGETVSSLRVPSLVEVNGDVFAVAEAQLKDESGFTGIASELLKLNKKQKKELDKTKLKTQVLEECSANKEGTCSAGSEEKCGCRVADQESGSPNERKVDVSRPTTVVKGSDIYMLVGKNSRTAATGAGNSGVDHWGLLLVKGQVSDAGEEEKRICWNDTHAIPLTPGDQHKSLTALIGGGGPGVKMKDGTLVLPVEGTKENGKTVSLIIYIATGGGNLSKGMSADDCGDPSVVEWKGKLMMMTACADGRRRVYEIGDKGEEWTEALGTLSRVWGNKQGNEKGVRSGFITANIGGDGDDKRNVMLVTLPVYTKKEINGNNDGKDVLHLWMTDNTHIVDIGPVSGDDDAAASSLLYKSVESGDQGSKEEKLIALYEKKGGGETPSPGMVSVRLTEQLKRVREVLTTWEEVDDRVSKLCPSTAAKNPSTDTACTTGKITDGLVGFLSGNFSDDTWKDEYLGVNATVNKGNEWGGNRVCGWSDIPGSMGGVARWQAGGESAVSLCELQLHSCGDGVHPRRAEGSYPHSIDGRASGR